MATSLATSLPWALTGGTYDADGGNDLRNSTVTAVFLDTGIVTGSGTAIGVRGGVTGGAGLVVAAGTGMTVVVQPGSFVVPNTASPVAGGYAATLASLGTLTVAAADPSNPRTDIVVAGVTDNGNSTSSGWVQIITGTPASSPSPPSAPANSITLAQVTVPAAATSISNGYITDTRPFTVAVGGVLVAAKNTSAGYVGMLAYDKASSSFYHNQNASAAQMRVLPFAPVTAVLTGSAYSLTTTASQVPGLTATVTCDGQTDLKIGYHIAGFTGIPSQLASVTVGVYLDGTLLDQTVVGLTASNSAQGGFTGVAYTGSATANTPSAAAHTVSVQAWSSAVVSGAPAVHAFTGVPASAWLRVEPVIL